MNKKTYQKPIAEIFTFGALATVYAADVSMQDPSHNPSFDETQDSDEPIVSNPFPWG